MIYLASPHSHPDPKVREARYKETLRITASMLKNGIHVFSPIVHTHVLARDYGLWNSWDGWKKLDEDMIKRCNELWVAMMPGWLDSIGVEAEMKIARDNQIPIYFINPENVTEKSVVWESNPSKIHQPAKTKVLDGIGKDAPVTVNEHGGRQSKCAGRADLLPPLATLALAKVLEEGCQKYGEWNWLKISTKDNVNHALIHLFALIAGDDQDDHLEHAACRILFALEQKLRGDKNVGVNGQPGADRLSGDNLSVADRNDCGGHVLGAKTEEATGGKTATRDGECSHFCHE